MKRITVEIDCDEVAYLSLALDRLKILEQETEGSNAWNYSRHKTLQEKWDKIYRQMHGLRNLGVVSIKP